MDDREIVAAIAAGDPDGLAEAYDKYAESLYGYCHWMLSDPEDAAGAVRDTFVIADGRLDGLGDPRKLRPWLYAVARNEGQHRLRATGAGLDEPAGQADQAYPADPADIGADPADIGADPAGIGADPAGIGADRAELHRLVRAALGGLNSGEREVIELDLGHDLHGADLAAVLGVSRNQAHALASGARVQLEKALGALVVARGGRRACPVLDALLEDWDGRLTGLTAPMRKRVSRHIDQCDGCADRRYAALRPAVLYGMALPPAFPDELREEVLRLCASSSPRAQQYREDVLLDAGSFRPNGFPEAVRPPRQRMLALSGIAAAAGVLIAVAATGIITVFALTGSHAPQPAGAARPDSASGTGSGLPAATASTGPAGDVSPGALPTTSAPAITSAPPAVTPPSASPAKAKPSPSPAASSSSAFPTPRPSRPTPTPTGTSTSTATPMPTPSLPF